MKKLWNDSGMLFLLAVIWVMILFSDRMFGDIYGQPIENLVGGVCCFLLLTINGDPWFGVKNLRRSISLVLGSINIIIGLFLLLSI